MNLDSLEVSGNLDHIGVLVAASPVIVIAIGALLMLFFDLFVDLKYFRSLFSFVILSVAAGLVIYMGREFGFFDATAAALPSVTAEQRKPIDALGILVSGVILAIGIMSSIVGSVSVAKSKVERPLEYEFLMLMAVAGAIGLVASRDFLTLFLNLELLSLSSYCLTGAVLRRNGPAEAALKYLVIGACGSALILYGIALLYGATGKLEIIEIGRSLNSLPSALATSGLLLLLLGMILKLGLFPLHFWVPDVYSGGTRAAVPFLSTVGKVALVGVVARLSVEVFGEQIGSFNGLIWTVAVLSMLFGNLTALRQRDVRRMLAYSSIAQTGYIFAGVASGQFGAAGLSAALYYSFVYAALAWVAFSILSILPEKPENSDIALRGLGSKAPAAAWGLGLAMLGLAGLPPGIVGIFGKVVLVNSALSAGYVGLVAFIAVNSAISCVYYLRPLKEMFFLESDSDKSGQACEASCGVALMSSVLFAVSVVICLGGAMFTSLFWWTSLSIRQMLP